MPSTRVAQIQAAMAPFERFFASFALRDPAAAADSSDFVFGNPNEMPLPGFVAALKRWAEPQAVNWFAYKMSEPEPCALVAEGLSRERRVPFAPEDIVLTNGGFAALAVSLGALLEPGDEVVFVSPPWFFYEAHIVAYGGRPVRVRVDPETFDLDVDALEAALTERTRCVLINSPHNPTGKVYGEATLARLAQVLSAASERLGRPIYLLSDEAYRRILFDGRAFPSPSDVYPHTLTLYTYGKTLLTPGQRLGYIALPSTMPERAELREALFAAQVVTGYAFPNALLQHALPDLEGLSIDLPQLQRKRDRAVRALREMGYRLHEPEGTFYLMVRSPWGDDEAFTALLARHRVYVLPGTVVELPGTFRISLTASEAMLERALPRFGAALAEARALA